MQRSLMFVGFCILDGWLDVVSAWVHKGDVVDINQDDCLIDADVGLMLAV